MQQFQENPHRHLLEQQLPAWAGQATPEHWQTLGECLTPAQGLPDAEADWFGNALPELREAVLLHQANLLQAQHALGRALKGLKQIAEFCEPPLQQALAGLGIPSPVRSAELLRVERSWSWSGTCFLYRSERYSLLQAALQNFGDDATFATHSAVARAEDIDVQPITVTGRAPVGYQVPAATFDLPSETYRVTPLPLTPQQFADTCRTLDLGQRYQLHLQEVFEGDSRQQLSELASQVRRERLRLAASLARLRHGLTGAADDALQSLSAGKAGTCWQLQLFGLTVHELVLIDTGKAGLLLYLPDHQHALHACEDFQAVHSTLTRLLLEPQARRAFLGYLSLDQRARLLDLLHQNLDAQGTSADDQAWQAAEHADLRLTRERIPAELFAHLHERHVARLKQEAMLLAVPTVQADEQARQRRLAEWKSLGLDALMVAGLFIPAVGGLMLAVTACQLLGEAYEGYAAWSVGDRHAALGHLEAVGLNLALIGGLHAVGKVLPKVLGSPLMEQLQPVTKADGSRRLWRPDLAPYRSTQVLPETLAADSSGQWLYQGRCFIRIDGELYEQRFDQASKRWQILHPSDPDAYQPLLEHNGEGAWRGEHEAPHHWPLATLVRRLGPAFEHFDDNQLQQAARLCGISEDALRQVHLQGQPTPALLADTLARMDAERLTLAELERSPGQSHDTLFNQHYDPEGLADPIGERLQQGYPALSRPLCRRLAARLSPDEASQLGNVQPLPAWLDTAARQLANDLPLVRAIEGLCMPHLANPDSERLLWACLKRLAGWPGDLRLELRAASPQGPLLQAIGAAEAGERCVVLKTAEGYEAHLGERPAPARQDFDLCRAVLDSLPAAQRQQLGLQAKGADGLRQRLLDLLDSQRPALTRLLRQAPATRWQGGGLRGGNATGIYPRFTLGDSQRGRYQRLFPSASDDDFAASLSRWRRETRSAEIELTRLEERLRQLRIDLANWAAQAPHRQRAVSRIVSAWRRDSYHQLSEELRVPSLDLAGLELDNHDLATLALPDDFRHVEELDLSQNIQLGSLHPEFIERFPRLRRLHLRDCRFAALPALPAPLRLSTLDLQNNRITWDATAQMQLERAANLRYLDLSENPLLNAPNLAGLADLQFVQLDGASLTRLPEGLSALGELEVLDLSDNQFEALPEDLELPEHVARAVQLESDWLTPRVNQQIERYYQQHGIDLLVSEHEYHELLDNAGAQQLAAWQRLPLAYRRGLRAVVVDDRYMQDPPAMLDEFWRRLARIDNEPLMRDYALSQPAWRLLDLPL